MLFITATDIFYVFILYDRYSSLKKTFLHNIKNKNFKRKK